MAYDPADVWTASQLALAQSLYKSGLSLKEIGDRLGRSPNGVKSKLKRARKEALQPTRKNPPADFVQTASGMRLTELCKHYRASQKTVNRWLRETGAKMRPILVITPYARIPLPEDFAVIAPTKTRNQLSDHYRVGHSAISRWIQETGAKPKRATFFRSQLPPSLLPSPDQSLVGRAANHLRRWMPVYRARTANPKAPDDLWIAGRLHLTTQDMIAKAEAKGFNAGEWSRIAA